MTRGSAGQTTVMALGVALTCFAVSGLAVDGTRAFLLRRTLQNAADAAALAGASEIDRASAYASAPARLDPQRARRAAGAMLDRRALRARARIEAAADAVVVTLRADAPTSLLALVGVRAIPVAVAARAAPVRR